jgi:hypothetical protein
MTYLLNLYILSLSFYVRIQVLAYINFFLALHFMMFFSSKNNCQLYHKLLELFIQKFDTYNLIFESNHNHFLHDVKINIMAIFHQSYLSNQRFLQVNYLSFPKPMVQSKIQVCFNNIAESQNHLNSLYLSKYHC